MYTQLRRIGVTTLLLCSVSSAESLAKNDETAHFALPAETQPATPSSTRIVRRECSCPDCNAVTLYHYNRNGDLLNVIIDRDGDGTFDDGATYRYDDEHHLVAIVKSSETVTVLVRRNGMESQHCILYYADISLESKM